jgi:hypothetical protein
MIGKRFFNTSRVLAQRNLQFKNERNVYIKYFSLPTCKDCVYYRSHEEKTDPFKSGSQDKCLKYGEKNVVTGEINYQYADFVRKQDLQCGIAGKHFVQKKPQNETPLLVK